ncbi:hypothetical protein SAMN05421853_10343 [Roseivivax halotolerans]|jgi:hypothetical protein|uniref:Uncharacterized protein n=1 Tax=Roseivivax halotolerans TaxID=93684 RepID=A0A1I5WZT8_9RHOB|nr:MULTISPECIES: hypothetical protein [Roseivivax]QFT63349.1 hypothetical protein FIU91_10475 [Roseivivax sp. THAF30]SFQ25131.1 hypothetical protein SAMN05421853_10343 [Roseivivax halotolerans]
MSAELLAFLLVKSAGAGIGVAIGAFIGLVVRARNGNTQGLIRGSVTLTSMIVGGVALLAMMVFNYVRLVA